MAKTRVFVYGTLRNGQRPTATVRGRLLDLGAFPALIVGEGNLVEVEVAEIEEHELAIWDRYEGYDPITHTGLYLRTPIKTEEGLEGYYYEFENKQRILTYPEIQPSKDGIVRWEIQDDFYCVCCGTSRHDLTYYEVNTHNGEVIICEPCLTRLREQQK